MSPAERLRTRLMVAAQKFATELADAVIEASGEMDAPEEKTRKRRAPQRAAPVMPAGDPEVEAKAAAALAKLGIRKTG